jgi:hypothetical protein|tara:strand:+ start:1688 stop:1828 length:141 start_codon:yes stop_codon:yes gene_type:complete
VISRIPDNPYTLGRLRLTSVDLGGVLAAVAFVALGPDPVADYLLSF